MSLDEKDTMNCLQIRNLNAKNHFEYIKEKQTVNQKIKKFAENNRIGM